MKFNFHYVGYGFAALIVLGLLVAYHNATLDKARSDAVQAAQATYQKQLTQQMADVQKQMSDRDVAYQESLKELQGKLQQSTSPQQIAQLVSQLMGLKQPIQIVQPTPTKDNPQPQPVAQIPLSDAPQAKVYVQDCETCKLELPKAKADLADRQAQMAIAQKQIDSLKIERDAAIKASKGGSFLKRFAKGAKVVACAAAGGAAGGASGKGAIPAAIGAGAGAVACSLF